MLATLLLTPSGARAAPTMLNVVSARTEPAWNGVGIVAGMPITTYRYIINVDDTGDVGQARADGCDPADPAYPASCRWPSVAAISSSSPILTQGDQRDFAPFLDLPAGKYVISVLADGFKLDGAHFTVPAAGTATVEVALQPHPLPTATLQALVFEDTSPVNGAPDVPAERGLAGFQGHLTDYIDFVTTDIFGNPLCTEYDAAGEAIPGTGGVCLSRCYDADGADVTDQADAAGRCPVGAIGLLKIPNLGPNRYGVSVVPPDTSGWTQTTTLEGHLEWDAWVMEAHTGLDTEFVLGAEPLPNVFFGYVRPMSSLGAGSGRVRGVVEAVKNYIPPKGGLSLPGNTWGGLASSKLDRPVPHPWVALVDLDGGDTAVHVGQGDANGSFDIQGVPDGTYSLVYWDTNLNYILDFQNVTVRGGETVDVGIAALSGWWTRLEGDVFNDLNRNGKRDAGEPGIAGFTVVLKKRENSVLDRGAKAVTTDAAGHYVMENAYPLTQWVVVEAYSDLYYTTGVTWQADNQPTETTILGAGVDVGMLPIIGLGGRLDWGVHAYDPTGATGGLDPRNGGIVGTVSYDTTRNELDPALAAVEDWQPGIPGLTVNLWSTVPCPGPGAICDPTRRYQLDPDGAYSKGTLLNSAETERWKRPTGCQARDGEGLPLLYPADQQFLPPATDAFDCVEAPAMGVQFEKGFSAVDGNYGFTDACFGPGGFDPAAGACADGTDPVALPPRDYLVEVVSPDDAFGRPLYQVTREEDINIFRGDEWVPQAPPPPCAGPLHTVDVAGAGTDGYPAVPLPNGVVVPASTAIENPTFADGGGSPFEGQQRPLCNTKLVRVNQGRSIAPTFNFFTDVPVAGRLFAYIIDDLNFSADPRSTLYGEKAGVPHAPIGVYDFTNRLVTTLESDANGIVDVLLPSTDRISCPTPSGVCANLYRLVGNDPGVPGRLNPNYNPRFRTIAAEFEVFPGLIVPADLAPTQVGITVQLPGGQTAGVQCALGPTTPQLFQVSRPYVNGSGSFVIRGVGFGATQGTGRVTLDDTIVLPASSWSDTEITVQVATTVPPGPHQLAVTAASGRRTVNGLTFHVRRGAYLPAVLEVGPGRTYETIQAAVDAAGTNAAANDLVVVYPGAPDLTNPRMNPRGAYYENVILGGPIKLQGVGPGGFRGTTWVPGSIIDGGAYGGDTALAEAWRTRVAGMTWSGNQVVFEGAAVTVFGTAGQYGAAYPAAIDGFQIRGGDQMGFPGNINEIGGTPTGLPANVTTQGGGVFLNGYAPYFRITNNHFENNGGGYGGAIRVGTPNLPEPLTNNRNEFLRILNNRIVANGGTNLAGGVGIFAGADSFEVAGNDICGNSSAEYGGGLTVYGYSPGGRIHHNRIYFNSSYDEGGGIMLAGELPADPRALSPGTGPIEVSANLIQANLANDDGGGLRLLMIGTHLVEIVNNVIANNVSTHEGGGIALDDAPAVRIVNNTLMKNLTTATAVTSNGSPAPAGLSTGRNSDALQATLPPGAPVFSDPLLFNNVFWDNRAGTRSGGTVLGLGIPGDSTAIDLWDMGVMDGSGLLSPTDSILQTTRGTVPDPSNILSDPLVAQTYDTSVAFTPWRTNPNFIGAILVAVPLPPELLGDYHLTAASPAVDQGAASKAGVAAPLVDWDGQLRPSAGGFEIGADELGSGGGGGPGGAPLPFPATPILDGFNRANTSSGLGASWAGATSAFQIFSSQVRTTAGLGGSVRWEPAVFGPNQEAYFTFRRSSPLSPEQAVFLKLTGTSPQAFSAAAIEVLFNDVSNRVVIRTKVPGALFWTTRASYPAAFAPGDQLGARALSDGTVTAFRNGAVLGSVNVTSGPAPWPAVYAQGGGRIGITFQGLFLPFINTDARLDDFGGGTMP
ncbi:MAG TPA: SdrD B-like domain-containing protein [Anaeromyxobacter sp.]|nr:SdrD B-like domain-containing protein [Anaeromyxobacter sp.]